MFRDIIHSPSFYLRRGFFTRRCEALFAQCSFSFWPCVAENTDVRYHTFRAVKGKDMDKTDPPTSRAFKYLARDDS